MRMNRKYRKTIGGLIVLLCWMCGCAPVHAQLQVIQQDAQSLVNNVLLGTGVTASNITFSGDPRALGRFNGVTSNIGLAGGVIMSTGRIIDAVGPNNSPGKGEDLHRGGYHLLQNLLGSNEKVQDAAVLRFNFICEGDIVQFRYVFASEEYIEYVDKDYNDIFGFFIEGPGIQGVQNIATIPGTNNFVSINNINHLRHSNYYVNNGGGSTVQFDGFTRPLTATARVIPCETYTITMAIADVGDGVYDSGVFLEAQSFISPEVHLRQKNSYAESVENEGNLYEGCGFNRIILRRTGNNNSITTLYLETGGTATYGVDYTAFPPKVTFLPGQDSVWLDIWAFDDGIPEPGGETVVIIYRDTGCTDIVVKQIAFTIYDPPPQLTLNPGNNTRHLCPRRPVELRAQASGGVGPYIYRWIGNPRGNPVTVYPDSSTWYVVTVTDQCGSSVRDSVLSEIVNYVPLRLHMTPDSTICRGEEITIGGTATGGKLPLQYEWSGITSGSQYITMRPQESAAYTLAVTDSCSIRVAKTIAVDVVQVTAVFDVTYADHATVQFTDLSYTDVYTWDWDFGDHSAGSDLRHPLHTFPDTGLFNVRLIVTNAYDCRDTVINPIQSYPPFNFYIPNAFTPDGDGINDQFSGVGEGFVSYEMTIYNRWGEEIFYTNNYDEKWGKGVRGVLDSIPIDVYVYKIVLITPTLERKHYTGRIQVIR